MKTLICAFLYDRIEIVLCPLCMTGKKLTPPFRMTGKRCCVTGEKSF